MLHDQVDDHPNSSLFGGVRELDKITEGSIARIDLVIV
jgi:hypothetical protein